MPNPIISEHPYSTRSQSQILKNSNPSSERERVEKITTSRVANVPKKPIFPKRTNNISNSLIEAKKISNQKVPHYEQQAYFNKSKFSLDRLMNS